MSTHSSIVCGLGPEGAEQVLQRSYELARARDLSVVAVHAVDLPLALFHQVDAADLAAAREAALDRLGPSLAEAGGDARGRAALDRDLRVVPGPAARALLEAAEEAGAARLVLGEHHREGLTDLFRNTTRAVLSKAECPVWIQSGPVRPVRKILVAVDLAPEGRQAVALAREEALASGAELELVHVFQLPALGTAFGYSVPLPVSVVLEARETAQREFDRILDGFEWGDVAHRRELVDGDPRHELTERAAQADLVVLGTHGGGGFSHAVIGSVASHVIRSGRAPTLVFRLPHDDWTT